MAHLDCIILVRHGETVGESSIRFHGSGDVPLSDEGREQMRSARQQLPGEVFDRVVSSPLSRAWEGARIMAPSSPIHLEPDFCEIDFGRWEGLTKEEIEARDPILHADWQAGRDGFEFPGGERKTEFRARVLRGLDTLQRSESRRVLLVAHKGIVRTIAETLTGESIDQPAPLLGQLVQVTRRADGIWHLGRRGSDPTCSPR